MLKTTQWQPDTCRCLMDFTWDTDAPEETRVHTIKTIHRKCEAHAHLNEGGVFDTCVGESQLKQRVLSKVSEVLGKPAHEALPDCEFIFDEDRRLSVRIAGTTKQQHTAIENILSTEDKAKVSEIKTK